MLMYVNVNVCKYKCMLTKILALLSTEILNTLAVALLGQIS